MRMNFSLFRAQRGGRELQTSTEAQRGLALLGWTGPDDTDTFNYIENSDATLTSEYTQSGSVLYHHL